MKHYSSLFKIAPIIVLVIVLCSATKTNNIKSNQDGAVEALIDSKNYTFSVAHVIGNHFSGGNYFLKVINDSLSAHLPYIGTSSNAAAYTTDDNGINVDTKDFTYSAAHTKKGGFLIKILLKNDRLTQSFLLSVNNKGNATLSADELNRDPVSFYGPVTSN